MDVAACRPGSSCPERELSEHVGARDLERAARVTKLLLDRNAHARFATGVLQGLARRELDPRMALGVVSSFEAVAAARSHARRKAAAVLLMTSMRAVTGAIVPPRHPDVFVMNASSTDIALANPDRAAAYAAAMCRTMPVQQAARCMAGACERSATFGRQRCGKALRALEAGKIFARAEARDAAMSLLDACVRAAYVAPQDIIAPGASQQLIDALSVEQKERRAKPDQECIVASDPYAIVAAADAAEEPEDGMCLEDKMAVIWTFVKRAPGDVPDAAELHADSGPTEIKVVGAPRVLVPPALATVQLVP